MTVSEPSQPWVVRAACLLTLLAPSALLILIAVRTHEASKPTLIGAAVFAAMYVAGLILEKGVWRSATGKMGCLHFASSLGVLWYVKVEKNSDFWAANAGLMILPAILLMLPAAQALASVQRRARQFIQRLSARSHWPENLGACIHMPEVKMLQDMLVRDAEPALSSLNNVRPQVRLIVLGALRSRDTWLLGQAERVLATATYAQEPPVRAAALLALGNVRDPYLIQKVADFSTDYSPEVRQATFQSLLYNAPSRWQETRRWIHDALADRRFIDDGPLPMGDYSLPVQALDDLAVWACEPGICSRRSLASLILYCRLSLERFRTPEILQRLHGQVLDSKLHSSLRVEIAFLLRDQRAFNTDVLRKMLETHQPSQIRLLAAGELLSKGFDEKALEALREVARQPNREIAIGVAQVLQSTMQIEMGLPSGADTPSPNTKAAAEVARRVSLWTQGKWPADTGEDTDLMAYRQTPAATMGSTATIKRSLGKINSHSSTIETPWLE